MFSSCCRKPMQYVPLPNSRTRKYVPSRGKCLSIFTHCWIIIFFLGGFLYFINYFEVDSISLRFAAFQGSRELPVLPNSLNGYLINTPGCRIPEMPLYDTSVKEFVFSPPQINCNEELLPLFESNFTSIYMNGSLLPRYHVTNSSSGLSCCYEEFKRLEPGDLDPENSVIYSKKCIQLNTKAVQPEGEFYKVVCETGTGEKKYEDYFSFAPIKKKPNKRFAFSTKLTPSVLIVGLDAISRVNLHRQLPNTYKYLMKDLNAIELLGYNKVADNTFPNLIPVFTGLFQSELEATCWPESNVHFDRCPFLWKSYSNNNYVTAIGEDCAWIGLFNYQKSGFKKQTSDYYYTTFSREIESNIGTNMDFNCVQCVGGRESYKVIVDYIKKFTQRMKLESTPYFGFFWGNSLSHDYLNRPYLGDASYYNLFRELNKSGSLDNTVLIFMSDHGIRWGDIRQTYQGQMEERLPFVIVAVPKWFKENYPVAIMNLQKNVRRLTTPFDLHETLRDLLDVKKLEKVKKVDNGNISRGYSLFTEIPKTRSCQDAEIVSHWCTCQESIPAEVNDTLVIAAAKFAVNDMNSQLEGFGQCATLFLDDITSARVLTYDSEHITDKKSIKDYTITLKTIPGDGIFEVTVRFKDPENEIPKTRTNVDEWRRFKVIGTVSRLSMYGKQSYCITDFHLKLYCYCKSLLKS